MELLARASFLRTLAEYAEEARRGDGRLVLISGESGLGKTALAEALQRDMTGALARVRRAVHAAAARTAVRHRVAGRR